MNIFFYLVVSIVLFNINSVTDVLANDTGDYSSSMSMTPIDSEKNNMDSIQRISEINIDTRWWLRCSGSVPNTMFTIFPSDNDKDGSGGGGGVTVETSPANLFTVTNDWSGKDWDSSLKFEWNQNVSSIATYGGVRIGVPSDQLLKVWAGDGHNVQILDGFTNITSLSVTGFNNDGSILHALMTTSISTSLSLSNNGGYMYVKTNIPVDSGLISSGGRSYVETPSYNTIWVWDVDSELNIKGDINVSTTTNTRVTRGAQLTVTGTITGTIYALENSTVNAPSCDNVISDGDNSTYWNSTCNAGPQTVDVDLSQNNIQTLNGTRSCDDGYDDVYLSDSSSSFTHVCLSEIIIAVAAAAVASTSMLI